MVRFSPSIHMLAALGLAAAATAATFVLVGVLAPEGSYPYELFFHRSWIQYATTFCFWVTMATLGLRHGGHFLEAKAFRSAEAALTGFADTTLIWSESDGVRDVLEAEKLAPFRESIVISRILNALERLRKSRSTSELDDYMRARSEMDYSELESSYATIRYFIWLIPTLGFIGTVMGIGIGIAGFASIIQNADNFRAIQEALPEVTGNLGTAFDTTLLALGLSALAVFYSSFLLKQQEQLLGQIDNLCIDGVVALFREYSPDTDAIIKALGENIEQLRTAMNGNRGALEALMKVITEKLQGISAASGRQSEEQSQMTQQLTSEMHEMKVLHKWLRDDISLVRKSLLPVFEKLDTTLERNNELLERLSRQLDDLEEQRGRDAASDSQVT